MTANKHFKIADFIFISIAALIISILTYKANGSPFRFGIDPSWHFGLNYFFHHHLQFGSQVHFTYGPFGFLIFSLPLGHNLLIASWFWFISRFILAFLSVQLLLATNKDSSLSNFLMAALGLILFLCLINVHLLFFLSVALILKFNLDKKQAAYLVASSFVAVLTFLIKPGLGLYNFLALYCYLFIFSMHFKNWKYLLLISTSTVACYLALWLTYYQNLSGSLTFLHSSWELITGFNQAMHIAQPNSLLYISLSLIFLLLSGLSFYNRPFFAANGLIVFLIMLPVILLCYKFSYAREDQHMYLILTLLIMTYSFWWLLVNTWPARLILLSCGMLCCWFVYANQLHIGYKVLPLQPSLGWANFYNEIIQEKNYKKEFVTQSQQNFSRLDLPLEKLIDIEHHSFDVYPYNTAIIPAKNLSWRPRPVMQSYTTYTPYLDNLNAAYFNQHEGADYIIWHDADTLREIDQRYLLNSEPNTSFAILNYYQPILTYKSYLILKKRDHPAYSPLQIFAKQQASWNQWIAIPKNNYPLVRSKIFLQQSITQKLRSFFYPPSVTLDYLLSNKTVISYPLIVATAQNGIWIKPLIQSLTNTLTKINLADYPHIPNNQVDYQLNKAKFSNGFLLLSGSALVKNFNPKTAQVTVILANDKQAFAFKPEPHTRLDVIAKFPAILANPQLSGFIATLNLSAIPTGDYHLYLQMTYQNQPALFGPLTKFTIGDKEKQRSETVTAIRLRQNNNDYKKEINIEWMGALRQF